MSKNKVSNRPGILIAFEGGDGSGKSTVARWIVDVLNSRGIPALYLKEPTDGPIGKKLREAIASGGDRNPREELRLFIEDRRGNVANNILPALTKGEVVCIDRYYISTMAYQGAFGINPEEIRSLNEEFAPIPDLILYFKAPWKVRCDRIMGSRMEGCNSFEQEEYQLRIEDCFNNMDFQQMITVNAAMNLEKVKEEVLSAVKVFLQEK